MCQFSHCKASFKLGQQAFPYLLPKGAFDCNVPRDIPVTPLTPSALHQTHKIKPGALTAGIGMVKNNFKAIIEKFVANDNAFSYMSSVKGTPACRKRFFYGVIAAVKQLGMPTYFLTLSCADLRWEELSYIVNKLNNLGLSDEELKNLSYQERCNLLNKNPVLVARHFQHKVEVFFKEIILDGPLGKTKYYAIRIEFQERGSPHVHSFIWIFNAPNIQNETAYIEFIEKTINAQLPDHLKESERFELVKTYQIHAHSRTCWKYNKNECCFSYGRYFTEKTIIAKRLDSQLSNDEKEEVLT